MDRNFDPFATCILNKQGHIINGNIPVALNPGQTAHDSRGW